MSDRRALLREPGFLSINEAADAFGISQETARLRVRDAGLEPLKIMKNGLKLFDPAELRKCIASAPNRHNVGFSCGLRLCAARDCYATYRGEDKLCPACRARRVSSVRRAATLAEAAALEGKQ